MGRYNDEPLFLQWEIRNKALKYWPHYSLGELSLCFVNSTLICQRFPLFSLQRSFLHMISPLLLEDSWNAKKIPRDHWRVTQVVYALIVGPKLFDTSNKLEHFRNHPRSKVSTFKNKTFSSQIVEWKLDKRGAYSH